MVEGLTSMTDATAQSTVAVHRSAGSRRSASGVSAAAARWMSRAGGAGTRCRWRPQVFTSSDWTFRWTRSSSATRRRNREGSRCRSPAPISRRCRCRARHFHVVVVTRYLDRQLFPALRDALVPGGVLLYETFTEHQLRYDRGSRSRDHLLAPGELRTLLRGMDVLFDEEVIAPDAVARVAARRRRSRRCSGSQSVLSCSKYSLGSETLPGPPPPCSSNRRESPTRR